LNKNLDLENYQPHLRDFFNYSSSFIGFANIFVDIKKEIDDRKTMRTKVFYGDLLERETKRAAKEGRSVSPVRLRRLERGLPTLPHDDLAEEDFRMFAKTGKVGWSFICN